MENIGFKLKQIRESLHLTRKEVSEKLREYGIDMSDKTLYGYEVGRTSANADTFLALCDIYQIQDILDTFGRKINTQSNDLILSNQEADMVLKMRDLDEYSLESIDNLIKIEVKRKVNSEHLLAYVERLKEIQNGEST